MLSVINDHAMLHQWLYYVTSVIILWHLKAILCEIRSHILQHQYPYCVTSVSILSGISGHIVCHHWPNCLASLTMMWHQWSYCDINGHAFWHQWPYCVTSVAAIHFGISEQTVGHYCLASVDMFSGISDYTMWQHR